MQDGNLGYWRIYIMMFVLLMGHASWAQAEIDSLRQVVERSRSNNDSSNLAKQLNQLGYAFSNSRKADSARHYFEEAIALGEAWKNPKIQAAGLRGLGMLYRGQGKFNQSLPLLERALAQSIEAADQKMEARLYRDMTFIYVKRGNYDEGIALCQKSLAGFEALKDDQEIANTLNALGLSYFNKGDYDQAEIYLSRCLDLQETLGSKKGLANAYGNLGMVYGITRQYPLALEYFEQSLKRKMALGDKVGMARTQSNLANIYDNLGEDRKGLAYYEDALKVYEEVGNQYGIAVVLSNMSRSYQVLGEDSLATGCAERCLEIARKMGVPSLESRALSHLGKIYQKQGQLQEAEASYQAAISVAEPRKLSDDLSNAYIGLAELALKEEDWIRARSYAENGMKWARQGNTPIQLHNAAAPLWKSLEALGKKAEAYDVFQLYTQMKDSIIREENQWAALRYEYREKSFADSLQNAKLLAVEVEENKQRETFSYFLLAGLLITALFGAVLLNRFQITRRQKKVIEAEKGKLDEAIGDLNEANQKLKELDDFKSRFFTNISHEFRTPLTVIQGMSQQLLSQPHEEVKNGAKLIERNSSSLLNLINQILDLRKLESGKLTLNKIQDDVVKFFRQQTGLFESLARAKGIHLEFKSELEALSMDFDPEKLGQIHRNLLSNAIKFTPKGGKVTMSLKKHTEGQLKIEVKDNGAGIPAEKLPLIFDRFYQADNTDTREGEGTGIGLSLTKELVQLMEGEIQVESQEGMGTTMTVILPVVQRAAAAAAPVLEASPAVMPTIESSLPENGTHAKDGQELPSLLIIEDNPDIVSYLYSLLEGQYTLSSAPNGETGIEMALEQVPDLIITDVMMPKKNGYEVTETLKLDERTSHIPIVMLTAKADHDSKLEGYQRGADVFLAKPFDQAELKIRLEKLWEIRKRLQARYQKGVPQKEAADVIEKVEDAFITKVRTKILARIDDAEYRGEALGQDLDLSKSNLYRKLKALTGMSIAKFIRSVRLDYAEELLIREKDVQIAEVAYASGFNDPGYFNRVFSEKNGISPGEWRENKRYPLHKEFPWGD